MSNVNHATSQPPPAEKANDLRASALGWPKLQFAVLGFIGLCGVLKGIGPSGGPHTLQIVAAILILLALIVACYATFLVGRAAWPLYSAVRPPPADSAMSSDDLQRTGHRLRTGLGLTLVALILAAAAATSSWWPAKGAGVLVSGSTTSGAAFCGTWTGGGNGTLLVQISGQPQQIPLSDIATVTPASSCG